MSGKRIIYNIIDFLAIKLCLTDIKLHAACDQADSGFWLRKAYLKETTFSCHQMWDDLPADQKAFYRKAARASIYEDIEITRIPKKVWAES